MNCEPLNSPTLFWPKSRCRDSDVYQAARRVISDKHGEMPRVASNDLDMAEFFKAGPDTILYYPVFANSVGWWGELLGGGARVCDQLKISPECRLMAITGTQESPFAKATADRPAPKNQNLLFAAEIFPTPGFFKKLASVGATISDMLATESGTALALFSSKNQSKFQNFIESTGNFYLGCVGGY